MKKIIIILTVIVAVSWGVYHFTAKAADASGFQTFEYATIRWEGRENTHFIRPNGKVEMLGPILTKIKRPERVDERAFYMNVAMNAVAKEGFEFAGMTGDEVVLKRAMTQR